MANNRHEQQIRASRKMAQAARRLVNTTEKELAEATEALKNSQASILSSQAKLDKTDRLLNAGIHGGVRRRRSPRRRS